MNAALSILLAEDDEADVLFMRRALRHADVANPLEVVNDGYEAVQFLDRARSHPDTRLPALIILDLKMPRRNGIQVLQWMREDAVLRAIPALVLSSSTNQSDVDAAYGAGANGFIVKPPSLAERNEIARFIKDWLRLVQPPTGSIESYRSAQANRCNVRASTGASNT